MRPADWFRLAPEEAAPSGPILEPVRPDNEDPGAVALVGPWGDSAEYGQHGEYAEDAGHPEHEGHGEYAGHGRYAEDAGYGRYAGPEYAGPQDGYQDPGHDWAPDDGNADDGVLDPPPPWEPVAGQTEARSGRAGGPGFPVPAGSRYGLYDPENRSGWQRAHDLWQDSGIGWDSPDGELPAAPTPDAVQSLPIMRPVPAAPLLAAPTASDTLPPSDTLSRSDTLPHSDTLPRREARPMRPMAPQRPAASPVPPQPPMTQPPMTQPPAIQPPRVQPLTTPPPRPQSPGGQAPRARGPAAQHPWEVRRPGQDARGSRPRRAGGSRSGRRVAQVGVPLVVILAVGAGALAMLTGKAHEALQRTGSQSTAAPAATGPAAAGRSSHAANGSSAPGSSAPGSNSPAGNATPVAFPGYPGQQGSESVNAIGSAGGIQFAAGSADGRAAIWHRDGSGAWSLVTGDATLAAQPAGTVLNSITHGPAGWLAVGDVTTGGVPTSASLSSTGRQPVVLTSKDGVTWLSAIGHSDAFSGPGFTVNAAAAGAGGYVVVGEQVRGGVPTDAMWWSADLVTWVRGTDTIASTLSSAGSGMTDSKIFAVAVTPSGFVAVGTHNDCHTAWVTADGQHWQSYDIPKPNGSQDPLLNHVAVLGNVVVASGDLTVSIGRIPLAVVSDDDGVHWHATPIGNYGAYAGPQGTVTALAADGAGFLAAGVIGPDGARRAVTWTSPDGVTWSTAVPAHSGTQQITALAPLAGSLSGVATVTARYGTQSVEVAGVSPSR